jgi:hypothetical protein
LNRHDPLANPGCSADTKETTLLGWLDLVSGKGRVVKIGSAVSTLWAHELRDDSTEAAPIKFALCFSAAKPAPQVPLMKSRRLIPPEAIRSSPTDY